MYICEYQFKREDPYSEGYSLCEIDFYMSPKTDHRLSLRKNLEEGKYEVYRSYYQGDEEVAFESESLEEAIEFAKKEYEKRHDHELDDEVCEHELPKKSTYCAKED